MQTKPTLSLLWLTENYFPNRGGMAQSCDRITHNLRQAGANVHILHFGSRKSAASQNQVSQGSYLAVPFDDSPEHSLNIAWLMLQDKAETYTHVVAFGGFTPIFAAPLFAQWLGLPLITLLRGNDFDAAIFSPKRRDILLYALANSTAVCSVSQDKIDKIRPLLPNINLHYTPNGIDLDDWQPLPSDQRRANAWRSQNVAHHKRVIGLFGLLKAKKGIDFFLQALHAAQAQDKIHLLITGEISDEHIIDTLQNSGFSYSLLPFLDRYELLAYYPACDAVAIPSFYDGMPNVLLEAGSLAIPFIAADVAGMHDFIEDGKDGFLFRATNIRHAQQAIRRFCDATPTQLQDMGKSCQQKIQLHYTQQQETNRYLQILLMR
jgi:glycogen(starch) synthase